MRKLKLVEDADKKRRNKTLIVGFILVGLMIVSTAGYSLMSNKEDSGNSKVKEGGLDFYREGDIWRTTVGDATFRFTYLPSEVENVSVQGSYDLGSYYNQPLYLAGPNDAYSEVLNVIGGYTLRYQEACLNGTDCGADLPIKDCNSNVIVFSYSNETKVYNNQSCVFIQGDLIQGADAFLYKLLGL